MTPTSTARTLTLAHPRTAVRSDLAAGFDSRQLLRGEREIVIRHGGEVYRLRHTRNDKLILTK